MNAEHKPLSPWRARIHEIIYEADTFAGKFFDLTLLCCILLSIIVVMLESVESIHQQYGPYFECIEWVFTALFTIEYILRIICIGHPRKYIFSFYGFVDLLSILPSYIGLFWSSSSESLIVIRALRLLRVFRLFKLVRYVEESHILINGLRASFPKIIIFTGAVLTMVVIMGTIMYLIEGSGGNPHFDNIFRSMYWAIVTLSTVGYGDIVPSTVLGQIFASCVMVCAYGIIAVPPAIVTIGMVEVLRKKVDNRSCPQCSLEGHEPNAHYCYDCGAELDPDTASADDEAAVDLPKEISND